MVKKLKVSIKIVSRMTSKDCLLLTWLFISSLNINVDLLVQKLTLEYNMPIATNFWFFHLERKTGFYYPPEQHWCRHARSTCAEHVASAFSETPSFILMHPCAWELSGCWGDFHSNKMKRIKYKDSIFCCEWVSS